MSFHPFELSFGPVATTMLSFLSYYCKSRQQTIFGDFYKPGNYVNNGFVLDIERARADTRTNNYFQLSSFQFDFGICLFTVSLLVNSSAYKLRKRVWANATDLQTFGKGIYAFGRDDHSSSLLPVIVLAIGDRRTTSVRERIKVLFALR